MTQSTPQSGQTDPWLIFCFTVDVKVYSIVAKDNKAKQSCFVYCVSHNLFVYWLLKS